MVSQQHHLVEKFPLLENLSRYHSSYLESIYHSWILENLAKSALGLLIGIYEPCQW